MKFGVCAEPSLAQAALALGYDYAEWSVGGLLNPTEEDAAFRESLATAEAAGVHYPVLNCFVPASHPIVGDEADQAQLTSYVTTTMQRAKAAGVGIIVFGSGGARRIPEGFDRAHAWEQLRWFCGMVAPIAHAHDVIVVVDPLNLKECNVLNTVEECARLVEEADHPGIRLLADAYHMKQDNDDMTSIVTHGHLLAHAHLATIPNRRAPGAEDCSFDDFFSALQQAGYCGGVSIEAANIADHVDDLPRALDVMRRATGSA